MLCLLMIYQDFFVLKFSIAIPKRASAMRFSMVTTTMRGAPAPGLDGLLLLLAHDAHGAAHVPQYAAAADLPTAASDRVKSKGDSGGACNSSSEAWLRGGRP